MTATEELTRALLGMAERFERTPCADKDTGHMWTSELPEDRALAMPLCGPCPLLDQCGAYAAEVRAIWGVWAGTDRSTTSLNRKSWKGSAA